MGCGLACVAMIDDVSYSEVRERWLLMDRDESIILSGGSGVSTKDIQDLLRAYGKPWNCILMGVPGVVNIGHHFVVIDTEGQVLDPC
jgi:hypothetical protein